MPIACCRPLSQVGVGSIEGDDHAEEAGGETKQVERRLRQD
jgi:hypothetical protein